MVDGFYSIFFTGISGVGFGVLVLKDNEITGADATGATYDGSYTVDEDESFINGKVKLTVPPGTQLVTGAASGSESASWDIPLKLPVDLGDGQTLPIKTPTGPVNVIFKKIRDLN